MADCHRRTSRSACKSYSGFNSAGWRHRSASALSSCENKEKFTVVYLVRSSRTNPNPFSHDWHVQPSCQRPNRIPPKRREFSPEQGHTNVPTACPRNLSNIQGAAKRCQPQHPTGFPDVFHIRNFRFGSRTRSLIRQTQKQVPHPRFRERSG